MLSEPRQPSLQPGVGGVVAGGAVVEAPLQPRQPWHAPAPAPAPSPYGEPSRDTVSLHDSVSWSSVSAPGLSTRSNCTQETVRS